MKTNVRAKSKKVVVDKAMTVSIREIESHMPCSSHYGLFLTHIQSNPSPGTPYATDARTKEYMAQVGFSPFPKSKYSPTSRIPLAEIITHEEGMFWAEWLALNELIPAVEKQVVQLEKEHQRSLKGVEAKIGKLETRLEKIEEKQEELRVELDSLEEEANNLESDREDLEYSLNSDPEIDREDIIRRILKPTKTKKARA